MLHYFLGTIEEIDQTETYLTRSRKQPFSDAGNVGLSSFWAVNDSLPICLLPSEVTGAHSVLLEKVVTGGGGVGATERRCGQVMDALVGPSAGRPFPGFPQRSGVRSGVGGVPWVRCLEGEFVMSSSSLFTFRAL